MLQPSAELSTEQCTTTKRLSNENGIRHFGPGTLRSETWVRIEGRRFEHCVKSALLDWVCPCIRFCGASQQ